MHLVWASLHSPSSPSSCTNHFHFSMELFRALPALLEHFSDITQDIVDMSGFRIILCPSVRQSELMPNNMLVTVSQVACTGSSIWECSCPKSQWLLLSGDYRLFNKLQPAWVWVADTSRIIREWWSQGTKRVKCMTAFCTSDMVCFFSGPHSNTDFLQLVLQLGASMFPGVEQAFLIMLMLLIPVRSIQGS